MPSVECITTVERWRSVKDPWDALVCKAGGSVYQTYPWLFSWWDSASEDVKGRTRELAIFLVWERNVLLGVAPFFLHRRYVSWVEVERRLRLLGCGGASNHHDFVSLPGMEAVVGESVATEILRERLAEAIFLSDVPERSATLHAFIQTMRRHKAFIREWGTVDRYTTLVPASFEEFLAGLDRDRRWQYRRAARTARSLGVTLEVVPPHGESFDQSLANMLDLHCHRWHAAGTESVFSRSERRMQLLRAVHALAPTGWVHLATLKHESRTLAATLQFFFSPSGTAYRHLEARDLTWDAFAPGRYLLTSVFAHIIQSGLNRCDHGQGQQNHKKIYKPIGVHRNRWLTIVPAPRYFRGPVRRVLSRSINIARGARRKLLSATPATFSAPQRSEE